MSERDRRRLVFGALAVAFPLVFLAALSLGSVPLPAASVLRSGFARLGIGGPTPLPEMGEVILWSVRLPRVLIAALVGGGLELCGGPALFTEGLLRIARDAGVPVVMFTLALDLPVGRRELRVSGPFDPHDPGLLQHIASYWEALLREKSWGFTLWPMMGAYFVGDS